MAEEKILRAQLFAPEEPDDAQKARLNAFIANKYGENVEIQFVRDNSFVNGFKLIVGEEVYDWTKEGRLHQLEEMLREMKTEKVSSGDELISLMKSSVHEWEPQVLAEEEGHVESVGDGIVFVDGLKSVMYGEIVIFESGVRGMVQELRPNDIGVILFGDDTEVTEGSRVLRTGKTAGIPVGDAFLGRVVDPLGNPIDGEGPIDSDGYRAVETAAPGIVERQSVDTPMNTGILSIDSMFPIGRGQRELIIGDRQTGKTAIAIDTILNQKDNGVICIYVAIGQKASSVAQLVGTLKKKGALDYTIVVAANASETAPIQYIAPYSGAAMAEYFMWKGKDVQWNT